MSIALAYAVLKDLEVRSDGLPVQQDPFLFRLATAASRFSPRGKGAIPRAVGRMFGARHFATRAARGFIMVGTGASMDMLAFVAREGQWEDRVICALLDQVGETDVIYDIGANAGYYSLFFAAERPRSRVIAFEPLPALASGLAKAAELNRFENLQVLQVALSDATGMARFFLPRHTIHASLVSREANARPLDVRTFKLDDLVASGDLPPPKAIKMDVEGAEMLVLAGARETLSRHKPVICYEADINSRRFGHEPRDVMRLLQELGYSQFLLVAQAGEDIGRTPRIVTDEMDLPDGDYIALR